jgi:hypothetical protein
LALNRFGSSPQAVAGSQKNGFAAIKKALANIQVKQKQQQQQQK